MTWLDSYFNPTPAKTSARVTPSKANATRREARKAAGRIGALTDTGKKRNTR
ncbi:hypothetical protein [Streptomyces sp. CS014]|uniref:hypothetical protein n=1 Tax=Streptomyces sp. CS014 TaxID=2162707 RepID=UPI0013A541DD|nr:hypothetical protein [Streptomyces sp. CS014]